MPNVVTWVGVLLMITGGIAAYPTLQSYIAPSDTQELEFSVTAPPPPPTVVSLQSVTHATATLAPTLALPVVLPETELATPETQIELGSSPGPTTEATSEPTATPSPTPPPTPTATPDPVSLVPNRIVIPAISLDAPVVEVGWETKDVGGQQVSSWVVPDSFAAGWHKTSAYPGQIGNTVMNGHHNINGEVFRDLVNLEPGDKIQVQTGAMTRHYAVTERYILEEKGQSVEVRMQNAQWILPTEDERLTLVTCWPYTNNTHRLVVVARPVVPVPSITPPPQTE